MNLADVFAAAWDVAPARFTRNTMKRADRRSYPIHAYVGSNGGGKSLAAVWDTLPSLSAGRQVLSTVRLLDWEYPRLCDDVTCDAENHDTHMAAHPLWIPFKDPVQLLDAEHVDVIMDEVTGVASSREFNAMPAAIANSLVQLRRRDVTLRWTTPNWKRADTIIRECTQAATVCRGSLPVRVPVGADEEERAWRHRRLLTWVTYDASDLDDFTAGKRAQLAPWVVDRHWGPKSPAISAYDTFDAVLSLLGVTDFGTCVICQGTRRRPQCKGHDGEHVEPVPGRPSRAPLAGATDGPTRSRSPRRSSTAAARSSADPTPEAEVVAV